MLGVTAHCISTKFEMKRITIALQPIDVPHTGLNLACLLKNTMDQFKMSERLYCITADNAANNITMAQHLHNLISTLDNKKHLHGCFAHVINLVEKAGFAMF